MKKLAFLFTVVAAVSFASCGNKAAQSECCENDTVCVEEVVETTCCEDSACCDSACCDSAAEAPAAE